MATGSWTIAEAKVRFGKLIDCANRNGPQIITRHGQPAAVLVSVEQWEKRRKRSGNLAEFFAASPLRDSGMVVERAKNPD